MKRSRRSQQIEEPSINLTPLIDVVFVILIMFILVAPLLEMDQVELAESGGSHSPQVRSVQESSPLAIHVHKNNTITFQRQTVSGIQLQDQLRKARQKYPKARLQVFHDKKASFGTYQTVKNAAEAAGFDHMDIVLQPG